MEFSEEEAQWKIEAQKPSYLLISYKAGLTLFSFCGYSAIGLVRPNRPNKMICERPHAPVQSHFAWVSGRLRNKSISIATAEASKREPRKEHIHCGPIRACSPWDSARLNERARWYMRHVQAHNRTVRSPHHPPTHPNKYTPGSARIHFN